MCWKCGKAIEAEDPIGRSLTCDSCGSDVRSCRNCRFYSPGSFHDCSEGVEFAVTDKERANFCEMFHVNPAFRNDHAPSVNGKNGGGQDRSRDAFNSLFS